ncbi:hypothetical protein [Streptomyces sp. NPDC049590]|uniref:hypothetical protein n=1 Tax=Streptomyces sp. NPDC049590 TaxID=3154834 RepID=UPI003430B824
MPDPAQTPVRARFLGTTVEFHCAHARDADHLRYYLSDHLVPEHTCRSAELGVRLEADGDGCLTAALGTATAKRVWWRTPGGAWRLYEEWGVRARLPSPVPPFGLPPLRDRVRLRHGAALAAPDGGSRALAVTGASGTGKSVVVAHLLRRGWRFVSDDLLVLDRRTGGRLYYYGRPVGVRARSLPLLPWLDAALLSGAPCVPTRWGGTWMVRPQRLGRCAPSDRPYRLSWRLGLARGDRFTARADGPVTHVTWDPHRHLALLLETCGRLTEGGPCAG